MIRCPPRPILRTIGVLGTLALLAAPPRGLSQDSALPVISKVIVRVDGRLARKALADLVPFKPGDTYSPAGIDRVVKQVYKTGLFSDIRVTRSGEEKVELVFDLTQDLIIRGLHFQGIGVRASKLRETVESLQAGSDFVEDRLPRAVEELEEGLRREGYFGASVVPSTRKDQNAPRTDVYFRISGWKRYRIGSLEIQGPTVVPLGNLITRMKSRKGELYIPSRLDKDIQVLEAYYTSLGYMRSEIQLAAERFDDGRRTVALVLDVQPREKIAIVVNGARVPSSLLAPIWEERIFEDWGLAEGEVRVLNYLRKKGYVYATLKSRIERTENEIRVVYDVVPGKKYSIKKISFEGLKSFSAKKLREELLVSERALFFSLLSYDRLFALPQEIEYFYRTNGFPDVRAELELPRDGLSVNAILKIEEGPHRTIQSITLTGTHLFPPQTILKELVSVKGGPFFPPNVQRDAGIIDSFYLNHGIRGTKITPRVESAGANLFALTFEINEGTPVTIENILITGNRLTRLAVIEKELRVRKGGPADLSLIQESKRRLERLGVFSEVRTDEILTEPGKENLVVTVQEGEANYAGAGLGFESRNAIPSSEPVQFRPSATGEYIRSNVFGMAAALSLVGQYSDVERRAILSWNQPYLFGAALRPALLGWIEKEDRTSYTFDRRGVSFNLSRPLAPHFILIGALSWSRTDLSDLQIPESEIDVRLQHYSTSLVSVTVALDKRDDSLNPEKGYFLSVESELAKPLLGTESDYWKTFFKLQYFKPVIPQVHFSLLVRVGLAQGEISVPERFFAGGSNSFRGEWFDYLGPKDAETGYPDGGRALFLLNAEMRFPLIPGFKDLSGAVFFDVGNVFSYLSDVHIGDLEEAAGLGIRYKTPLGPVRFELAWNVHTPQVDLVPPQTRKKTPYFFFTIGNMF
ncbi:MAG: POTRA domain-containing protein [Candidatus Aminicenantales bacterium]|jgi:outer membrane protein assembly complex protein YaeT